MPFSTRLFAEFMACRTALIGYWFNILLSGLMLLESWKYARRAGQVSAEVTDEMSCAGVWRIVTAQLLYAVGATCCFFSTCTSIAVLVLVQLNFALAPRLPLLSEI